MHTVCSSDVLTQCSLAQAEYQDWINQGLKLNMATVANPAGSSWTWFPAFSPH